MKRERGLNNNKKEGANGSVCWYFMFLLNPPNDSGRAIVKEVWSVRSCQQFLLDWASVPSWFLEMYSDEDEVDLFCHRRGCR